MKPTLYMTIGLPASGKTTWAKAKQVEDLTLRRVNRDDLRALLDNGVWSKDNESLIVAARDFLVGATLRSGRSVIVDDTNLQPHNWYTLRDVAARTSANFVPVDFTSVPLATCRSRDAARPASVGNDVMVKLAIQLDKILSNGQLAELLAGATVLESQNCNRDGAASAAATPSVPNAEPVVKSPVFDPALETCILVDVDGTVALKGDRERFDETRVLADLPNQPVISVVKKLAERYRLIFMSGRGSGCREDTLKWLFRYGLIPRDIHMRRQGDSRKDSIVKEELYRQHVEGKYNVLVVIDDRASVVRMWRSLGLTVLQCAEGNF